MTSSVAGWFAGRTPEPPPALAERLLAAVGGDGAVPASAASDVCLDAAERLVGRVLRAGARAERARETALDLLCADALVTYAFEAAADDPDTLPARADAALARFAALAAPDDVAR